MVFEPARELLLHRAPDLLMQCLAPLGQQRVVGNFQRERMLESVFDFGEGRLLVDEFRKLEAGERSLQLFVLPGRDAA